MELEPQAGPQLGTGAVGEGPLRLESIRVLPANLERVVSEGDARAEAAQAP